MYDNTVVCYKICLVMTSRVMMCVYILWFYKCMSLSIRLVFRVCRDFILCVEFKAYIESYKKVAA